MLRLLSNRNVPEHKVCKMKKMLESRSGAGWQHLKKRPGSLLYNQTLERVLMISDVNNG